MKLYGHPMSANAFKVAAALKEKKLAYEDITVDLLKQEQRQEEFKKINSRGQVPVLVDGDISIRESAAILLYLEDKYKDQTPLLPSDPVDRARAYQLLLEVIEKLSPCNFFASVIFRGQGKEELGERIQKLKDEVALWNSHLEGREYLAGSYSVADIVAFFLFVPWVEVLGLSLKNHSNLDRWFKVMQARPAIAETGFVEATKRLSKPGVNVLAE